MKLPSAGRRALPVRLIRTHPGEALVRPTAAPTGVTIGLVGAGKGGAALLDLLLEWSDGSVAVVVDLRPDAPGLRKARARGIPTALHIGRRSSAHGNPNGLPNTRWCDR